jgi:hypothetical protein
VSPGSFDPFAHLDSKSDTPIVEVIEEAEAPRGWSFKVALNHPKTTRTEFTLIIAWVDHDFLTGGGVKPSKLARVIAELAADVLGDDLPAKADAAMFRRRVPGFDDLVCDRMATTR